MKNRILIISLYALLSVQVNAQEITLASLGLEVKKTPDGNGYTSMQIDMKSKSIANEVISVHLALDDVKGELLKLPLFIKSPTNENLLSSVVVVRGDQLKNIQLLILLHGTAQPFGSLVVARGFEDGGNIQIKVLKDISTVEVP